MKETILSLKAHRDVMLLVYGAVTQPKLIPLEEIHALEGGIVALDMAIETVRLWDGK